MLDPAQMTLTSNEHGGLIRSWVHDIVLEPLDGNRTRYTDRVRVDAGWATTAITVLAWLFYEVRQNRWQRLAPTLSRPTADEASR